MKNSELQKLLSKFPANWDVKLMPHHNVSGNVQQNVSAALQHTVIDFTEENVIKSSEKAYIDANALEDIWDTEDGKIRHKGKRYLLINPIIH